MTSTISAGLGCEERAELLAIADAGSLVQLAEACVAHTTDFAVLAGPDVGVVLLDAREPVEHVRFRLGDVLVTQAEVCLGGTPGWAMRMGDDRIGCLAAAVCDAEVEAGGVFAFQILELCEITRAEVWASRRTAWRDIAATAVSFEELD